MKFEDLKYKRAGKAVKDNDRKQGSGNPGKDIQGSADRVQEKKGKGSKNTTDA